MTKGTDVFKTMLFFNGCAALMINSGSSKCGDPLVSIKMRQVQNTGHRSKVSVLPIQKVSQTLVKANLRPKNVCLGLIKINKDFCLGLIWPKVSFYKCLGYFLYW